MDSHYSMTDGFQERGTRLEAGNLKEAMAECGNIAHSKKDRNGYNLTIYFYDESRGERVVAQRRDHAEQDGVDENGNTKFRLAAGAWETF